MITRTATSAGRSRRWWSSTTARMRVAGQSRERSDCFGQTLHAHRRSRADPACRRTACGQVRAAAGVSGAVDELSACIGLACALLREPPAFSDTARLAVSLGRIQDELSGLCADLAAPSRRKTRIAAAMSRRWSATSMPGPDGCLRFVPSSGPAAAPRLPACTWHAQFAAAPSARSCSWLPRNRRLAPSFPTSTVWPMPCSSQPAMPRSSAAAKTSLPHVGKTNVQVDVDHRVGHAHQHVRAGHDQERIAQLHGDAPAGPNKTGPPTTVSTQPLDGQPSRYGFEGWPVLAREADHVANLACSRSQRDEGRDFLGFAYEPRQLGQPRQA